MLTVLWLGSLKQRTRGRYMLTLEECIIVDIKGIRWEVVDWIIVLRIEISGGTL